MKFINTLKTRVKNKINSKVKEIVDEYIQSQYKQKIEFIENDIDNILSSHNNTLKDIAYLAEALKQIFLILDDLNEDKIDFFDNSDDDDKTFHW